MNQIESINDGKTWPCMDGEDVVCVTCGEILGWPVDGDPAYCPGCGLKIDWKGWEM